MKYLKALATGLILTAIMAVVMLKITMNFQVLLFLGVALFFIGGRLNAASKIHFLLTTILISIFYLGLFILIVLAELPVLWYFVPIYFLAALLGVLFRDYQQKAIASLGGLFLLMVFLATKVIPGAIEESLTQNRFDQLPSFTIEDMTGQVINAESLKGKVVVLDFFGTWCKPCVLELKELNKVQARLSNQEVVFLIVNPDLNDTPEKFAAFIKKNNYPFQFAYDYDSHLYKQLQLQQYGLPTLLVIDKDQNIRKQHVGYNAAETNFADNLYQTIKSLE